MCYALGFSRASITVKVPCLLRVKYIFKIFSPCFPCFPSRPSLALLPLLPLLPSLPSLASLASLPLLAFPSSPASYPSHYPCHKLKGPVRPYRWKTLCAGGVFGVPCLPCLPGLWVDTKKPTFYRRPLLYSYLPSVAFNLAFKAFTFSGVYLAFMAARRSINCLLDKFKPSIITFIFTLRFVQWFVLIQQVIE